MPAISDNSMLRQGDDILSRLKQIPSAPTTNHGGLVSATSGTDMQNQADREAMTADVIEKAFADVRAQPALAGYLHKCWEDARTAKTPILLEMMRCYRQRNGQYEPDLLQQIKADGAPEVYVMLTDIKCRAVEAWLREVMLSGQDDPWDLSPESDHEIPPEMANAMLQEVWQMVSVENLPAQQVEKLLSDARAQVLKEWEQEAETRTDAMKGEIKSQLDEGGWEGAFSSFLGDFSTYPSAFVLGPQLRNKKRLEYSADDKWIPKVTTKTIPTWESVSPFDVYPQPAIINLNDGYVIVHTRMDRRRLGSIRGVQGCHDAVLSSLLTRYASSGFTQWLNLEKDFIDQQRGLYNPTQTHTGMFDVLRFFGSVPGQMLIEWGVLADPRDNLVTPDDDYDIEAWLIGADIVYCRINPDPLGRKPLMKASAIEIPGQFWGKAVPTVMRHVDTICNAAARAIVENMSMASGPQIGLDTSMLAPGESPTIKPWKVWPVSVAGNNGQLPISFFQPELHAAELMGVYKEFAKQADEVTGIPAYTYGGENPGGAGNTASGLSMLMGAASKGIRQMIATIDREVVRANVTKLYQDNLQYSDDESIKGDLRVVASGSVAVMQKETLRMRRIEFLNITNNPQDMQIVGTDGRAEVLRSVAQSLEMHTDRIIPTREAMIQRRQQEELQQQQQQALAMQGQQGQPGGVQAQQHQDARDQAEQQLLMQQNPGAAHKMALGASQQMREQNAGGDPSGGVAAGVTNHMAA